MWRSTKAVAGGRLDAVVPSVMGAPRGCRKVGPAPTVTADRDRCSSVASPLWSCCLRGSGAVAPSAPGHRRTGTRTLPQGFVSSGIVTLPRGGSGHRPTRAWLPPLPLVEPCVVPSTVLSHPRPVTPSLLPSSVILLPSFLSFFFFFFFFF